MEKKMLRDVTHLKTKNQQYNQLNKSIRSSNKGQMLESSANDTFIRVQNLKLRSTIQPKRRVGLAAPIILGLAAFLLCLKKVVACPLGCRRTHLMDNVYVDSVAAAGAAACARYGQAAAASCAVYFGNLARQAQAYTIQQCIAARCLVYLD